MASGSRQWLLFHRYLLTSPAFAALVVGLCAFSRVFDSVAVVVTCLYALRFRASSATMLLAICLICTRYYADTPGGVLTLFWLFQCFAYVQPVILAWLLRSRSNWQDVIAASVCLNFVLYALLHLGFPAVEVADQNFARLILLRNGFESMLGQQQIELFIEMLLPIQLIINNVGALFCLGLARGWQARLFHPQGFKLEVQGLRHSTLTFSLFFVGALSSIVWHQDCRALLVMSALAPVLVGLSFCHWWANYSSQSPKVWLSAGYLLALVTMPFSLALLMCISVADYFYNLRLLIQTRRRR